MSGAFFGREPHDAFAWMRANAPVYYDEANDLWAAASYAAVKQASVDTESFSNAGGIRPKFPPLPMMIDFDAPEHVRRRRLVSEGFTPKRVRAMEDKLRLVCDALIDRVCEEGSCDFVKDIAAPLPIIMIGDMLGVAPEDRDDLLRWSDDMLKGQGSPDPDAMDGAADAFGGYSEYIHPVFDERRATRQHRRPRGRAVPCRDRRGLPRRRFAGPRDAADPDRRRRDDAPRDQRRDGGAARAPRPGGPAGRGPGRPDAGRGRGDAALGLPHQEHGPDRHPRRRARRSAQIGEGQELLLLYPSANRDEAVFEEPDTFDITRNPNPHMAFGFGAHFCLGNQLARLEMRVMVERVLARMPDLRLAVQRGALPRREANFISGIEAMPVAFTPSPSFGIGPV